MHKWRLVPVASVSRGNEHKIMSICRPAYTELLCLCKHATVCASGNLFDGFYIVQSFLVGSHHDETLGQVDGGAHVRGHQQVYTAAVWQGATLLYPPRKVFLTWPQGVKTATSCQ